MPSRSHRARAPRRAHVRAPLSAVVCCVPQQPPWVLGTSTRAHSSCKRRNLNSVLLPPRDGGVGATASAAAARRGPAEQESGPHACWRRHLLDGACPLSAPPACYGRRRPGNGSQHTLARPPHVRRATGGQERRAPLGARNCELHAFLDRFRGRGCLARLAPRRRAGARRRRVSARLQCAPCRRGQRCTGRTKHAPLPPIRSAAATVCGTLCGPRGAQRAWSTRPAGLVLMPHSRAARGWCCRARRLCGAARSFPDQPRLRLRSVAPPDHTIWEPAESDVAGA